MRRKMTERDKVRIKGMLESGDFTVNEIVKMTGWSRTRIAAVRNQFGIRRDNRGRKSNRVD